MQRKKPINFVRVAILDNWRYWQQFGGDAEAAGRAALDIADALLRGDKSNEVAKALLEEAEAFSEKMSKAGSRGNEVRWHTESCAAPEDRSDVAAFADGHGIETWVADEFFDMNRSRDWVDPETGKRIRNWKGALVEYARKKRRSK